MAVEENAVQNGFTLEFNPPFFDQFATQRVQEGFADFDPAAWQMPAGDVAVLDQKHLAIAVEHDAANPKGHAAGETPIQMKQPAQRRF